MHLPLSLWLLSSFAWETLGADPPPNNPSTTHARPSTTAIGPGFSGLGRLAELQRIAMIANNASTTLTRAATTVTTTTATTATTASNKLKYEGENNEHLCKNGEMTTQAWKDNNVDHYLKQFWDMYPKNPLPENDGTVKDDASFLNYLAQISGDYGNFKCDRAACDIDVKDQAQCEKHPMINFILYGFKNFWQFYSETTTALNNQHDSFGDKINKMALQFMQHDLKPPPSTAPFILVAALMGALGAFSALGAVGATTAGVAGIGTGIMSTVSDDRIKTLQKEIENTGKIYEAFGKVRDGIWNAINETVDAVLTSTPKGAPKGTGAVDVLSGGYYVDHPDNFDEGKFNDKFTNSFSSAIVTSCWYADQVFIVRVPGRDITSITGKDACTVDLSDEMNKARVCIGKYTYIFIRTDDIWKLNKAMKGWKNPAGLDKLKDYDLDLKKLVQGAEWYEKEIGAWSKKLEPKDIADYIKEKKKGPPNDLWVNLPIIDYEKTPNKDPKKKGFYGRERLARDHVLNNCRSYIKGRKGWPYDDMEPGTWE